ncbi:MAG: MBL fold metallo-hydrolase [Acidimicrobiia bacterium]|nr:MBL fold metallo-hydrolase [Acidimicrobiia bacterium]
MTPPRRLTRRSFIRHLGKGTLAVAVLGPMACSDASTTTTRGTMAGVTTATSAPTSGAATTQPPTTSSAGTEPAATTSPPAAPEIAWDRVNLGGVSAYILARNGRAVIVDTGNPGSAPEIQATLLEIELGWDVVDHVILTHRHPDHVGGLGEVMANAPQAIAYAGEADIAGISSPRSIQAVGDGDEVVGLQIIETPGHTAGHVAVYDPDGLVLVAGDALNTSSGSLTGSNPRFTADAIAADQSVQKMAALDFEVLMVGHGDPVLSGATDQVAALAASL